MGPPQHISTQCGPFSPHLQGILVAEALGCGDDHVVVAPLTGQHALVLAVEHLDTKSVKWESVDERQLSEGRDLGEAASTGGGMLLQLPKNALEPLHTQTLRSGPT